jgi:hypothetical protein
MQIGVRKIAHKYPRSRPESDLELDYNFEQISLMKRTLNHKNKRTQNKIETRRDIFLHFSFYKGKENLKVHQN